MSPQKQDTTTHPDPEARVRALLLRLEDLEAFSFSAAHELRSPLISIGGHARQLELVAAQGMAPEHRARLKRIMEAVAHMERLIDALLGLSRAYHEDISRTALAADALVREVVAELRPAYPGTRIVISELPIVDADAVLARQVLANLIGNALKYSAFAHQPLVQIGVGPDGSLYVTDNGIGFGAQHADSIFEPFVRMAVGAAYPGHGLGLAVTRRLLERHGGWIRARSREGGPTTFTFSFGPE
jgi:two-component system, sensor histidine kinase and response regulator